MSSRITASRLIAALYDRDLEAAMALYEQEATLAGYPGMLVKGISDIRHFLKGLFSLNAHVRYETGVFTESGDLALFTAKWKILNVITTPLPMPKASYPVHISVLRKQPDGSWLIAVDNPWGPEPPPTGEARTSPKMPLAYAGARSRAPRHGTDFGSSFRHSDVRNSGDGSRRIHFTAGVRRGCGSIGNAAYGIE
jgi:ketosteroid isomerase-like protein